MRRRALGLSGSLALAAALAACGGARFTQVGTPEKPKAADCSFKVTEMPPDEQYWRQVGTIQGGSFDTVADFVAAVRKDACHAGAEMVVPEQENGKYVRGVAYVPRKIDLGSRYKRSVS